ncbi:MAG TPA: hypothetical protein VLI39_14300 [Sedimentisphaerales bacterium]|nr:hypothetical protein [Sedimentisphaerales bacterium]
MKPSSVIVLRQDLVKSPAWLHLNGPAVQVYLLFRTKCQIGRLPGKSGKRDRVFLNQGRIQFTYREARERWGFTPSRFRRAVDDLTVHGFIDVTASGMGVHKVVTLYAISERWRLWGTPDFVGVERPKPSIMNPGFQRGNKLGKRRQKKQQSSVKSEHGAVHEIEHGVDLAVREIEHGEKSPKSTQTQYLAEVAL